MASGFLVGVLLEVLSAVVGTVGKQLIGLSAKGSSAILSQISFWTGMFMTVILGAVLDAAAFGFAPQAILAPLNGLNVCLNLMLAPFILGERVTLAHVLGTLLVAIGASLSAVAGPHDSEPRHLDELQEKLFRRPVLVYMTVFLGVLALCALVVRRYPRGSPAKARAVALGVSAGALEGNMFFLKCMMGLLRIGFEGDWTWLQHWLPYVLGISAILVTTGNVPLMARGLQEFEAVFMVAMVEGANIAVACISAEVVLNEMHGQPWPRRLGYSISVLVVFSGLAVMGFTAVKSSGTPRGRARSDSIKLTMPQCMVTQSVSLEHLGVPTARLSLTSQDGAEGVKASMSQAIGPPRDAQQP